jgi:xanthine dehydrogenase accessory factor
LNNSELKSKAQHWLDQGLSGVRVSILSAQGSTPRPAGTFMLVSPESMVGTIGGGHLELEAIALARDLCESVENNSFKKRFSLGPSLGQCCGGAVELQFDMLSHAILASWPEDRLRFTLALFGAGHVGRALVDALSLLPCKIIWIDEREDEFPKPRHTKANVEVRCVDVPDAEMKTLPHGCFVIITTHSHDLDLELCESALGRADLGFIGLIGSATKKARFLNRLEQKQVAGLERLVCPIGLSSIQGKEPQVIAASVAAQLLELSA